MRMTRNKVVGAVRRQRAGRRDRRRAAGIDGAAVAAATPGPARWPRGATFWRAPGPGCRTRSVAWRKLRAGGRDGGGRRKPFARAITQVSRELGLDDADG
jgi:hypothetical protein